MVNAGVYKTALRGFDGSRPSHLFPLLDTEMKRVQGSQTRTRTPFTSLTNHGTSSPSARPAKRAATTATTSSTSNTTQRRSAAQAPANTSSPALPPRPTGAPARQAPEEVIEDEDDDDEEVVEVGQKRKRSKRKTEMALVEEKMRQVLALVWLDLPLLSLRLCVHD